MKKNPHLCIKWFNAASFFQCHFNNDQEILLITHAAKTHISSDHNVKADCEGFVESPIFGPVLCLEIFGKSALKDSKARGPTEYKTGPSAEGG